MFRKLTDRILVSPQISVEQVGEAKAQGVTLIINNRPDDEEPGQVNGAEIEAAAQAAGIAYLSVPVAHGGFAPWQLDGMAQALVGRHGGDVPADMGALTALPGVGRKTANVVLGNAYGLAEGIAVDTHASRLSLRLGLTDTVEPVKAERELMAIVPRRMWTDWTHLLIAHGRAVCTSRKAHCNACILFDLCPTGPQERSRTARPARAAKR